MSSFDSDSIARLAFLPRRVAIAGAGIIALEFAKIFSKLGCSVTMLVRGEAEGSLRRGGLDEALVHPPPQPRCWRGPAFPLDTCLST